MRSPFNRGAADRSRVVITFADQVVASASNFITGVAIARLAGPAEFGRYMLVLLVWLVVVGAHRRLINEPVIITSRDADAQPDFIAKGLSADIIFGVVVSVVVGATGAAALLSGSTLGPTLLAFTPWFVVLLVQDYWRAVAFQRRSPNLALINDVVFALVQVVFITVFALTGRDTAGYMISAWGLGAAAGAVLGLKWFPTLAHWRAGARLLRQLWPMSRWLLADFVTAFASQQAYVAFAALLLTQVEYGGFRAAAALMGPIIVILLASSNVGLPEMSRRVDGNDSPSLHRYVRRLTATTFVWVAAYSAVVAVAAGPILGILYGPEFRQYAPLAALAALQYVVIVTVFGEGIALRATGEIRRLWPVRIVIAVLSLASMALLVKWLGYIGAGWAGVATFAYEAIATYLIYRSHLSRTGSVVAADAATSTLDPSVARAVNASDASPILSPPPLGDLQAPTE